MSVFVVDTFGMTFVNVVFCSMEAAIQYAGPEERAVHEGKEDFLWDEKGKNWISLWQNIKSQPLGFRVWASHQSSAPETALSDLANDESTAVRRHVADNPNTSSYVLKRLSADSESDVRHVVAKNNKTPVEALVSLARDPHWEVRRAVAWSERTPLHVLEMLAKDNTRGDSAGHRQMVQKAAKLNEVYRASRRKKP